MTPLDVTATISRLRVLGLSLPRIHFFPVISSTQDEAIRLARLGAPEGTLIVAGRQTKGRGRFGREWFSPAGAGLYVSVVLRPPVPVSKWATLSIIAGIAIVEELEKLGVSEARLKWPNDALVMGKKIAGILVEAFPDSGFAVLGVGLNASFSGVDVPQDLKGIAVDLESALKGKVGLDEAAARLLKAAIAAYLRSLPDLRIDPEQAKQLLWTSGRVKVGNLTGRVAGLLETGELILVDDEGRTTFVSAGEVADADSD